MIHVTPKVRLIGFPQLDWAELTAYLEDIGGTEWLNNVDGSDGEVIVEVGGRICYRSFVEGLNPNVTRVRKDSELYHGNVLASGHGSVLEHANYTFIFQDVSRVFTHELVRHRAGSAYSQESLRFVRLTEIPFWFPEWALDDPELLERSVALVESMEDHQKWMTDHFGLEDDEVPFTEKKHKTSFMRRFAPEGLATTIQATFNIRTIRHIVAMRTALGAEEEIRLVCDKVAELSLAKTPYLMQDYNRNEDQEWIPDFLKV